MAPGFGVGPAAYADVVGTRQVVDPHDITTGSSVKRYPVSRLGGGTGGGLLRLPVSIAGPSSSKGSWRPFPAATVLQSPTATQSEALTQLTALQVGGGAGALERPAIA